MLSGRSMTDSSNQVSRQMVLNRHSFLTSPHCTTTTPYITGSTITTPYITGSTITTPYITGSTITTPYIAGIPTTMTPYITGSTITTPQIGCIPPVINSVSIPLSCQENLNSVVPDTLTSHIATDSNSTTCVANPVTGHTCVDAYRAETTVSSVNRLSPHATTFTPPCTSVDSSMLTRETSCNPADPLSLALWFNSYHPYQNLMEIL